MSDAVNHFLMEAWVIGFERENEDVITTTETVWVTRDIISSTMQKTLEGGTGPGSVRISDSKTPSSAKGETMDYFG